MRLDHIFWALLLVIGLLIAPMFLLPMTGLGFAAGAAFTALFIGIWVVVLVGTLITIVLARTRKISGYRAFAPTLLFISNLYFALFSFSQWRAGIGGGFRFWNDLFGIADFCCAVILIAGVCVRKYNVTDNDAEKGLSEKGN